MHEELPKHERQIAKPDGKAVNSYGRMGNYALFE